MSLGVIIIFVFIIAFIMELRRLKSPQPNPEYIINVAELMKNTLPRPSRKYCKKLLTDVDGSYLPVISVTIELWEHV